jgi:hypothetical protein
MSKRRKKPPTARVWTPFEEARPVRNEKARALDPDLYDMMQAEFDTGQVRLYLNSHYTVHVRFLTSPGDHAGALHLSIRHNDRRAVRDWRHFQRIKNELAGPEREAVELYPAESRLVDEANSYHLWVAPEGEPIAVGFNAGRLTSDAATARAVGARQRDTDMAH